MGAVATVFFSTNNSIRGLLVHVLAYFSFLKLLAIFEQCKMKIVNYFLHGWVVNTQVNRVNTIVTQSVNIVGQKAVTQIMLEN